MEYIILIDLQLFSEEKTEKPTPKKMKESREKGQVLHSKEVNSAFLLIAAFIMIGLMSNYIGGTIGKLTVFTYENYLNIDYAFSVSNVYRLIILSLYNILLIILPVAGVCFLIGLIATYMQVGYLFTTKTLEVKFSKLNPIEGFKRIFSLKSLVELVKSIIKIIFIGYVVFIYARNNLDIIFNTIAMDIKTIVATLVTTTFHIGIRAGIVLVFLAILDYLYQKYDYEKNQKMTKQELKEEYKQTEGNPQIKSKIKEKQRQMSMRRMMQDIPKADVIITNPTHFAIAVQYNNLVDEAPKVLAKGQDLIAHRIRELANEHEIPIVENKPLARSLYDQVEIGAFIPPDLYQAVAEVLAYVYQINNRI
ncbi:flagellar biosynthesis protein FlhB [Alkaliphilus peptidifermentans]|uniref:Flagellar biosynthetic protein FlhB n=1 Tax=Alkaliphilus peptidifermentans DSM 18978 TaxID=1120976 RepID=A0A1G5DG95_9FIRM|nr:flagellar biosynthesis protein FlhB [Alkaliphilus peptidifermentans]SCY13656.1 flagellar biosynthetic protein FlhB [Alkaliphilus peptidifermentans DSM 18978]